MKPFILSATVDFPDDCRRIIFTEELLEQLFDRLRWAGVGRVYWLFYSIDMWQTFAQREETTDETLGILPDPMSVACRVAQQKDMEFYAIIKPYETGFSHAIPAVAARKQGFTGLPTIGGIHTWLHPWALTHPEMRVQARSGDVCAGSKNVSVTRIQLRQRDMAPVHITADKLEIWTSEDNSGYHKQDLPFSVHEGTDVCSRDVYDLLGNLVTQKGDSIRTLEILDLHLNAPFIAVTTNLVDETGTFRNTAIEMVRAFGPDDQPLPIVVANHKSAWDRSRDFRIGSLEYDAGDGDMLVCLDVSNSERVCVHCREQGVTECMQNPVGSDTEFCRDGLIAFAQGHNHYLSGALCEAYPAVQNLWLSWVGECLKAGVDGVDWRISNHSCWTNRPELYGFNPPVLEEYERRYGANPAQEAFDPSLIGNLRGEFYDQFLQRVKRRLAAAGKSMQVHLEVESFRPDAAQARWRTRPGNITFHWRRWLQSGLTDEVTLMGVNWSPERMLADALGREMLDLAESYRVPVQLRHPVWWSRDGLVHGKRLEKAHRSGKLNGYNLYETGAMYDSENLSSDGQLQFHPGLLEGIRDCMVRLGLRQQ